MTYKTFKMKTTFFTLLFSFLSMITSTYGCDMISLADSTDESKCPSSIEKAMHGVLREVGACVLNEVRRVRVLRGDEIDAEGRRLQPCCSCTYCNYPFSWPYWCDYPPCTRRELEEVDGKEASLSQDHEEIHQRVRSMAVAPKDYDWAAYGMRMVDNTNCLPTGLQGEMQTCSETVVTVVADDCPMR